MQTAAETIIFARCNDFLFAVLIFTNCAWICDMLKIVDKFSLTLFYLVFFSLFQLLFKLYTCVHLTIQHCKFRVKYVIIIEYISL